MVALGNCFLFGYNVFIGLKTETSLSDVFSIYRYENHAFTAEPLDLIGDERFVEDYKNLYKYYKTTRFARFAVIGQSLFMVFRVGKTVNDIKTFKWTITGDKLHYVDNRSDHEFLYPGQHEFQWKKASRDQFRAGKYPHISIEDKVFVETLGGDLTIKVEDNTETGEGIYAEKVDQVDQTLDDAEVFYAIINSIIVLKIRPYKENAYRYILYNQKSRQAVRVDSVEDACVLLPDNQGLIFPSGYFLQNGTFKLFENQLEKLKFEKRIASPNGEDYLIVFFQPDSGSYMLLGYNIIEQRADVPIKCHGYSIFDNGELLFFRAEDEPQKYHSIQIWQTPYVHPNYKAEETVDSYLYKIGNKELVRAIAECRELIHLVQKEDSYLNLYLDIVRKSGDTMDAYHWLDKEEAHKLLEPLSSIRLSATSAIDEFEKVSQVRKNTEGEVNKIADKAKLLLQKVKRSTPAHINEFVNFLAELRALRGEIIALKELRYCPLETVEALEKDTAETTLKIAADCAAFLVTDKALQPYEKQVDELGSSVNGLTKVIDVNKTDEEVSRLSKELEMLIEIVSGLKIEDATQTTRIIENISAIYARFNTIRAQLKNRRRELGGQEAKAEFGAQLKLIDQAVANYLEVCDHPDKCDQYLNKLMLQLEELEGKFAEYEEFLVPLAEKREEIYNVFESKKLSLQEERNRRTGALQQSADRILKGIQHKASTLKSTAEISGYFASDMMVDKVRSLVKDLETMGDTVKADALQSRLSSLKEEALRQLKDKSELFAGGENTIKLGNHHFLINTQPLDLTMLERDGEMYFHLTGTNFFEKVTAPEFLATKPFWQQHLVSENKDIYRAEYLAWQMLNASDRDEKSAEVEILSRTALEKLTLAELTDYARRYMASRFSEGFVKGVHDQDAARILEALLRISSHADLLGYSASARACAVFFWEYHLGAEKRKLYDHRLKGAGTIRQVFPGTRQFDGLVYELREEITAFCTQEAIFPVDLAQEAAQYIFEEISRNNKFILSAEGEDLRSGFLKHLDEKDKRSIFEKHLDHLQDHPQPVYHLVSEWLLAFTEFSSRGEWKDHVEEAALALLLKPENYRLVRASMHEEIKGLIGTHERVKEGVYTLHYTEFTRRLRGFEQKAVPAFHTYTKLKKALTDQYRQELKLETFQTKVLSSFVRNKLIDSVYLPLVGNNLAKQIGAAGDAKRTDLMGMLLLISPPGYGKTTLVEYIANRLGLVYVKVNGPAIGDKVTSLDPAEAPNAQAREELNKLNLAFEMGDNVMILIDDIQHCNPEFLQKFISLCDAQRKIEGVYKGRTKTYDLRGRKVCVVMAGNPYTESGEKFRIPDMLANRSDIYNLGDVIGDSLEAFKLSYIENSLTSNKVLRQLDARSRNDLYALIRLAETGNREGLEFEAEYSAEEMNEYTSLLQKLFHVRDILYRVNENYIHSAAQAEEFRNEPPFRLQGSYRDMNKLAEKIHPLTNDNELQGIILSHYDNESQTLTSGAEANFLKFKELQSMLSDAEKSRWEEIKSLYVKQNRLKGIGGDNPVTHVVSSIEAIADGLKGIREEMRK